MAAIKDSASNNSSALSTRHRKIKLFKLYQFIDTTYREIRQNIPGLETASVNDTVLMECINKYKKCILEIFVKEDALEYFEVCSELAQNISRTLDLFKEISAIYTNMDEYYHRVSELLSIFIACELRLSVDCDENDRSLIASRIIYIIKRHLTQEDEETTSYNILLTLVYIPRLFNAREIVCNVFEEFLPFTSHMETAALPDKMYIMYIIVIYRWMSMKTLEHEKRHIIDMAEMFMKPVVSLCNNQLYVPYLPAYTSNRTATRTILCNLKTYQDLRTASIIDNAFKKLGAIVNLCDDDDVIVIDAPQEILCFSEIFAAVQLEPSNSATSVVKHEITTIIDSVDLTVDDEIGTTECLIVMKYEKWLHNFQVMAKQFRESQTRLQRQNESRSDKVICLDSDYTSTSEEEEVTFAAKSRTKIRSKGNKSRSGKSSECTKQKKSFCDNNQMEDLFADNYPLTVTPIHCNADLESFEVGDAEDSTKLSRRILPIPLQTYESKKSSANRLVARDCFHNTQENKDERTTNKLRREKHISFSSSPLGPTPSYSQKGISSSQPTNMSAQSSEFFRGFDRYSSCSSNVTASLTSKQQEHIAAASSLFCNVFDRSHSNKSKHFLGDHLFSSTSGRSSHTLLSPTGGFFDAQHKKRNKIHGLMQRRATLSCRSDFDDYMAALETTRDVGNIDNFKIHPGHGPFVHQFPKSAPNDSICSEVSNEPGMKPVPASSTSDYDIINRYQFQDEKLMKNCAVIIEPTVELIQYERKRDAMYNELLQKQRRKMELRAIEKMKEKERRRQEKEMKREEYRREQRETMEKLERMKINESESSDNHARFGSDKETATERSCRIKHCTPENRLKETSKVEQQTEEHLQTSDIESRDPDLIPLLQRVKSSQQNRLKQSSRVRKRRQPAAESLVNTTEQSIRSKRIAGVQRYSEKFLESQNSGGRTLSQSTKQKLTASTNAKIESVREPSGNIQERRKSVCSNKLVEQTDYEMESVSHKANSMPRQSPRLQRNFETEHTTDSEIDKTISMKLETKTSKQKLTGSTNAKIESVRAPSRNIRERRKSVCSNKLVEQTDYEMEAESHKVNSMPRQSPRLQRNFETEHTTDSEIDKTISMKLPRPVRGRPKKQKNMNTKKPNKSKPDLNKIAVELDIEQSLNKPESNENESTLSERTIVASIAERLYSPTTIVVDKPLASSEQEEILETLEDLLGKETRLSKTVVASDESSSISRGSSSNVNSSVKMMTNSETHPDLEVIENIVINEIQREMDANRDQVKERTSQTSTLQNIISDLNDKSCSGVTRAQENQTYFENGKPFRSIPKKQNSPCDGGENVKKYADEQHLQDMINKSLQDFPSLTATEIIATESSTTSLLISRSESLNNPVEGIKALRPVVESRQTSILVTENILLSNRNEYLETSRTVVENNMLPPLQSSLLTEVETSMIQADLSDISPTSINIVMPIDEEDTTMPHNIDEITPEIDQAMDDNLSLETHNNELAQKMEDNGKEKVSIMPEMSQTKKSSNVGENLLLVTNNNGEEETCLGSPPFESLRVSSDDDGDKQSTTTDESHSNVKRGSDTSEGDDCVPFTSGDMEKLNTERTPPNEPVHVSSDDDEKRKPEALNESSTKVNVISETLNESLNIPFKTKACLNFPITKICQIKLKRVNHIHNNILSEKYDNLSLEVEDDENGTPIPSPSLDQEDSIVPSSEAVRYDESLGADHCRQSQILEEFRSVVIERYEEGSNPLPTILKSSTSQKPKANRKTVTFHPLAEVISLNSHYENRRIFDRDETPPPDDFYRDHNYDRKFRTPATSEHFNEDRFSNICATEELRNSSSSSQESEDDQGEIDIVLASSKGQEDIMRKNVQLQRVLLVPPDAFSPLSQISSPDVDDVPVENAEILDDPLSEERTVSVKGNGGIQIDKGTANGSLPIFILGDVIGNMPEGNQLQCSDEGRNVLVSTTYLTNYSSPGNHLVDNTVHNSMMSPSEHEVTSTQEATYQQSSSRSTIESDLFTSMAYLDSVREKSSLANAENSALLQNNQVDTTNHSPDMCTLPSHFNENKFIGSSSCRPETNGHSHKAPRMSTSTNESTKAEDNLADDISGANVANGYCGRLSPSTTTDNDDTVTDSLAKVHNSRLSRLKAKETRKFQHNSSMLKHRNPFIVRTAISSQKLANASGPQNEKQSAANHDNFKNTSTLKSGEMNNSKILFSVTEESQKSDNIYEGSPNQDHFKMVSNKASECPAVAKIESLPKKKFVLIRPKPYTTQKPSTSADNNDVVVKNSNTKKKCVLIRPKPVDFENPLTNVPQATKSNAYNHSEKPLMKKVERNLNEEFSYRNKEAKTGASLGSNLEKSVLEKTSTVDNTHDIQTMVNELLGQENKDEKCNGEAATRPDIEDAKKEIKCNGKTEIEDSGKNLKHKHKRVKSNRRHHVEMEPSKKDNPKKDKHLKQEDSKVRDNEKTGVAKKESLTVKTVREVSKGNTNPMDNAKRKSPKQEEQSRNKAEDSREPTHNKEIKMKVKINHRNNDGGANVEEPNRDAKGKDKNIQIPKTDGKPKDKIIMQNTETNKNQEDNQKMKCLKKSATEKYNTEVENTKKSKSEIRESKKDKAKTDDSKKEVKQTKIHVADPLKIVYESKEAAKRTHVHRDKELRRTEQEEPNKTGTEQDNPKKTQNRQRKLDISDTKRQTELIGASNKSTTRNEIHEGKSTTSTRRIFKAKNKLIEPNLNISTRSSTIIAVKMIPFSGVRQESIDHCEDINGVGMETEVVKIPKNQIVGVKMIKVNNVNKAITSSEVRPNMPIGQKSKHVSKHSVDNSTEVDKKLNRNINSIKKTPTDCENISMSSSKSATTSASTTKRNSNGSIIDSINDTNLSSINKKSISTDTSNHVTSAATVHSRKRRKTHI